MRVGEKPIKKLLVVLAGVTLFFNSLAPALAITAAEISGNGAQSENEVEVETKQEQTVVQQNTAVIKNYIKAEVSSGDNEVKNNTNGEVEIHTGAATANININNKANANVVLLEDCVDCVEDVGAKVSGNGAESENEVEVEEEVKTEIFQKNWAEIDNCVEAEVESGDNEAENNTGGEVTVIASPATANININNLANANWAAIVPSWTGNLGWKGTEISDNGAKSGNKIEIEQKRLTTIVQDNWAKISNRIETDVESGHNEANDNTNARVTIHSGPATANINLNNETNFNFAEVECCLFDKTAKVSGNGAESENEVEFEHNDELWVFQNGENAAEENDSNVWPGLFFDNWVEAEPESGENEAKYNTGENTDPEVTTEPATANINVNNKGGVNIFGRGSEFCLDWPSFNFDFDLREVWGRFFSY